MPLAVQQQLFSPFFTAQPIGIGTGHSASRSASASWGTSAGGSPSRASRGPAASFAFTCRPRRRSRSDPIRSRSTASRRPQGEARCWRSTTSRCSARVASALSAQHDVAAGHRRPRRARGRSRRRALRRDPRPDDARDDRHGSPCRVAPRRARTRRSDGSSSPAALHSCRAGFMDQCPICSSRSRSMFGAAGAGWGAGALAEGRSPGRRGAAGNTLWSGLGRDRGGVSWSAQGKWPVRRDSIPRTRARLGSRNPPLASSRRDRMTARRDGLSEMLPVRSPPPRAPLFAWAPRGGDRSKANRCVACRQAWPRPSSRAIGDKRSTKDETGRPIPWHPPRLARDTSCLYAVAVTPLAGFVAPLSAIAPMLGLVAPSPGAISQLSA